MGHEFELVRVAVDPVLGAFGVLIHRGIPFAVTLERVYGEPPEPKIPVGAYRLHRTRYHRGGYDSYEVPVEGHSRLLIHRANLAEELDGCIAVGESFNPIHGRPGIASSAAAFIEFMHLAAGRAEIDLRVEDRRPS